MVVCVFVDCACGRVYVHLIFLNDRNTEKTLGVGTFCSFLQVLRKNKKTVSWLVMLWDKVWVFY